MVKNYFFTCFAFPLIQKSIKSFNFKNRTTLQIYAFSSYSLVKLYVRFKISFSVYRKSSTYLREQNYVH